MSGPGYATRPLGVRCETLTRKSIGIAGNSMSGF